MKFYIGQRVKTEDGIGKVYWLPQKGEICHDIGVILDDGSQALFCQDAGCVMYSPCFPIGDE